MAARWFLSGALGVALITTFAFRLHASLSTTSFCFLLLLVVQSLSGHFMASVMVSVAAVLCLDYFFTQPILSFGVAEPFDVIGLVAFLVTSVIITKLVTKVRAKTEVSELQQERLRRLYELAQQLLAIEPETSAANFLEPFCGVFGIRAVCLFDPTSAELHMTGMGRGDLESKTGEAFIYARDSDEPNGISTRRIHLGGRARGAIGFDGLEDPALTAGPLAALAAAHLERRQAFLNANRAAAAVQTESYRAAILDALAHEFKTPLSTILAAAGALRETGALGPHHREMAETVESEAARLGRLTSRLIRTARLEREEVKPWMELIDLNDAISSTVSQYTRLSSGRRVRVVRDCDVSEVMADPELLQLAVSQLLDNACKYSTPGSTITLSISREDDSIAVRVVSPGNPIPLSERGKIFDRFYRGVDGRRMAPGSGLGLFVARKIALALGGSLDLDHQAGDDEGVAFRLLLPVPESERNVVGAGV